MLIDVHQHTCWHGADEGDLVADMDAAGIDVAWMLTWEIPPAEDAVSFHPAFNPEHIRSDGTHAGMPLSDALRIKRMYPERFILGYCPHPLIPTAPELFESAYRVHGVRVCAEWKCRVPFDDPRSIRLFRKAGQLDCPVLVHLDVAWRKNAETGEMQYCPGWYGGSIDSLRRAVEACPRTNFIGHAPGFWREISGDADNATQSYPDGPIVPGGRLYEMLDSLENLYADLSAGSCLRALKRDADNAREFLIRFADKVMFGRDCPGNDLMTFLKSLKLPKSVRDKIFFKNAISLVPLPKECRRRSRRASPRAKTTRRPSK